MHPELIRLGPIVLPTYGVLLATGFVLALWLVRRRASRFGIEPDAAVDISVWILLSGLLGSKALYVIVEGPRYLTSLGGVWELVRSGGVFYGGFIGAVLAAVLLLRKRQVSFWSYADTAAPAVALGHAVGRLGCFSAGCCWGRECDLPWAVTFTSPVAHANVGVPLGVPLHPTQLYESAGLFVLCGLLILLERRRFPGETFTRYLFGYALLRGTVEFFRGDPRGTVFTPALSTSQFLAAVGILVAIGLWWIRRRKVAPPVEA